MNFLKSMLPKDTPPKDYKAIFTVVLADGSEHELHYKNLPVRDIKVRYQEVGE